MIVTFRNFRSAADRAGLCQGDRLVEVNEKNVETLTYEELTVEIASWLVSRDSTMTIWNNDYHDNLKFMISGVL